MSKRLGIDLGTTRSAIAVSGAFSGEGFLSVGGCPGCTVITDRLNQALIPSAVTEDKLGRIILVRATDFGSGQPHAPVMVPRHALGTDRTFRVGRRELRSEDILAHVLRYLKGLAEGRLGERIEEAVISAPAWLGMPARQAIVKAGEMAGFQEVQIVPDPVAAVLGCSANLARDPLRILTYDLGGQTFDVAVLEKRGGEISGDSIVALDGDHSLGGCDFDRRLAEWALDQLCLRGYDLDRDPVSDTLDKLMPVAEQAKIALSQREAHLIQPADIGLMDRSGRAVDARLEITRSRFEDLIRPEIERTIRICRQVMEENRPKPIRPDDVDEILLVGGSSQIPLVARRLEEEFGRPLRLIEPQLCTALGAALLADRRTARMPGMEASVEEGEILARALPKPIFLQTDDGLIEVAPACTPLPLSRVILATISHTGCDSIRIGLLKGDTFLCEIITDLPGALRPGGRVEIHLTISSDGRIEGEVHIPGLEPCVAKTFAIDAGPPGSMDEEAVSHARLQDVQEPLAPDRFLRPAWRPDPPRDFFESKAREVREMIANLVSKDESLRQDELERRLEAIREEADRAYQDQNSSGWARSCDLIVDMCGRLSQRCHQPEPPSAGHLLLGLAQQMKQLRRLAEQRGRLDAMRDRFDQAAHSLRQIDPDQPTATVHLRHWYLTFFVELERDLTDKAPPGLLHVDMEPHRPGVGATVSQPPPAEAQVPRDRVDLVHFSVTSPPAATAGQVVLVDVWAHLKAQRAEVIQQAEQAAADGKVLIRTKGPIKIARGIVLTVRLCVPDFHVEPQEDWILWEGEIGNAQFSVSVPADAAAGPKLGTASIFAQGLRIAQVLFTVEVGAKAAPETRTPSKEVQHRSAFISYSSEDEDTVLTAIQALQKGIPDLNVFYAEASLRSGDKWQDRLLEEIKARDVMYLFWSQAASRSRWVEWEWRTALRERGIQFIDPFPLVHPRDVPPPGELADQLHFNDWVLAFKRARRVSS
ncbi:MAG: Chaperone protein DnaK [Planctomycetes bacterium ADurb.Bin126]|nr:MAG: Chaperone protein DnaK [Planctomycetes bacterium ADurb.Bin126]